MSEPLPWNLRWRLSVLWALQWGITGSILTYLPLYFSQQKVDFAQLGQLMAISAIGLLATPFVVGQICDRWMSANKYLALAHLVGGLLLLCVPTVAEDYQNFRLLLVLVSLYAIAYFPTIPLASALTFRHLPDPESQFSKVRIWGTVCWVLTGIGLSLWLGQKEVFAWLDQTFPSVSGVVDWFHSLIKPLGTPSSGDAFRIGALLSFALSSFCIFLPATPPLRTGHAKGKIAPLETLAMFKNPQFTLLLGISFGLGIVIPSYSIAVPKLIENQGIHSDWVPAVMTIGQISEFPALLLLPWCLKNLKLKATFALGILAWVVRYVLFAFDIPLWLMLSGIALHGVCHVFLVIVIQLYVDEQCRPDLKASAQNLFSFVTMGLAMPLGFLVAGRLGQHFQLDDSQAANYGGFFAVAAIAMTGLLILFLALGRIKRKAVPKEPPAE